MVSTAAAGVFPLIESGKFYSPVARCRARRDDERMAGRKRPSAEDIVRKLRRADELTAEGNTGEEIAAKLEVSPATLYNWRRSYGGMDPTPPKSSSSCESRTPARSGCWPRG